jgi:hypothetical protein
MVFKSAAFLAVCVHIVGLVGTHSVRKCAASLASLLGMSASDIEIRGRWKASEKNDMVRSVYITPEQPFVDASVAATLCHGSPVAYLVRPEAANFVTDAWIYAKVVPHLYAFFGTTESCVPVLGRALLFAAMDDEFQSRMVLDQRAQIRAEFAKICPEGWLHGNPVKRVRLHVYRKQHTLAIAEVPDSAPPGCNPGSIGGDNDDAVGGSGIDGAAAAQPPPANSNTQLTHHNVEMLHELRTWMSMLQSNNDRAFAGLRSYIKDYAVQQSDQSIIINDNLKRFVPCCVCVPCLLLLLTPLFLLVLLANPPGWLDPLTGLGGGTMQWYL